MKIFTLKIFVLAFGTLMLTGSCSNDVEKLEDPEVVIPTTFFYAGYKYNTDYKALDRNAILSIGDSVVNLSPTLRSDAVAIAAVNNKEAHLTGYQMTADGKKRIAYWKNKTLSYLTPAGNTNTGTAINVYGSKVYVGGTKDHLGSSGLFLWTNGVQSQMACCLAQSKLTSITESNGNPYLAGRFASNAHMFTQESAIALAGPNTYADYIHAINSDVYVIGHENYNSTSDAAVVWKNDVEVFNLPLGGFVSNVVGTMSGQDYYFVANFYNNNKGTTVVYKNNQKLYQLSPAQSVVANAIQVVGSKVYIAGNYLNGTKSSGVLWTDGQPKVLFAEAKKIYINDFVIR